MSSSAAIRDVGLDRVANFCQSRHDTYPEIDPRKSDLSGKSVVITGASKGVGRATAIAFAQAGASKIAITARSDMSDLVEEMNKAAAVRGQSLQVISERVDVTSDDEVSRFARLVGEQFGSVDLLVNNAGYLSRWMPFAETDTADWWRNFEVNIKGPYLASRHLMPWVLKSQLKTILNVSSYGATAISDGGSGYQTTKFALCRLTEFMAAEHADQGLLCVVAHPGAIKTDMGLRLPEAHQDWLVDAVELPAHWMTWLARERREWLQARFVSMCWDVTELEAKKDEIAGDNHKLKFRVVV